MTPHDLQDAVDHLAELMRHKGLKAPSVHFRFEGLAQPFIRMTWLNDADEYKFKTIEATTATLSEGLLAAEMYLDNLPDRAARLRQSFTEQLARTIELGKSAEIDVDESVLNPLVDLMKKLAGNAITHKEAVDRRGIRTPFSG